MARLNLGNPIFSTNIYFHFGKCKNKKIKLQNTTKWYNIAFL